MHPGGFDPLLPGDELLEYFIVVRIMYTADGRKSVRLWNRNSSNEVLPGWPSREDMFLSDRTNLQLSTGLFLTLNAAEHVATRWVESDRLDYESDFARERQCLELQLSLLTSRTPVPDSPIASKPL